MYERELASVGTFSKIHSLVNEGPWRTEMKGSSPRWECMYSRQYPILAAHFMESPTPIENDGIHISRVRVVVDYVTFNLSAPETWNVKCCKVLISAVSYK